MSAAQKIDFSSSRHQGPREQVGDDEAHVSAVADVPAAGAMLPRSLAILLDRASIFAERVRDGDLPFIREAVDLTYSAADYAGLVEIYGDDQIQKILAMAFMDIPR